MIHDISVRKVFNYFEPSEELHKTNKTTFDIKKVDCSVAIFWSNLCFFIIFNFFVVRKVVKHFFK